MKLVIVALAVIATPAAAQQRKPAIPQPTTPAGVASGTYGPRPVRKLPPETPTSRAARSDTTEILEAVAKKLSISARDAMTSLVTIQSDTAWVSLTAPKFRGVVYRLERHRSWKVVDQPGG